jgi:hypothetical protein
VLPHRLVPSRATVGRWVQHSAQPSRGLLEVLDRACQSFVLVLCLDEICWHREPILLGVEPISRAWLAAQRGPARRAESWGQGIAAWPHLEQVMAEGGQGLARGVKLANAARRQAQAPEAEPLAPITMGLAVFHPQREVERVVQQLWNRVERQSEAAVQAAGKLEQAQRRGHAPRGVAGPAGRAWRQAERLFDEAVQAQEAVEQSKEARGWLEASGYLYTRKPAQAQRTEALQRLQGDGGKQAKRLLCDARTLRHVDRLQEQVRSAIAEPMLRDALVHGWSLRRRLKQGEGDDRGHGRQWVAMACVLCGRLCPDGQAGSVKGDALLSQALRASRAVEGVNRVVRRHQGRHRHVRQEMLDLKRVDWKCRVFREGKRKGRRPYELLGLKLPTSDWWQRLQMDPKELEQGLSTQ